jgi:leucyl-tRNA---protein transferase
MKIFFSENKVDYQTYTFDYAVYCLKETQHELAAIYEKGFLPYTGDLRIEGDIFYLARSLRVNLINFEDTSENRRVLRLVEPLSIELNVIPKANFNLNDATFLDFCKNYISERIGDESMSFERLQFILNKETTTHFFEFKNESKTLGYVLACMEGEMLHYWFAFFDTDYMRSHSLGKWMMWRVIRWAKENGLKNAYLGTAYKTSALYKIRDHKGLEFFDGSRWNNDMKRLKTLCETDLEPKNVDFFKTLENPNVFLATL